MSNYAYVSVVFYVRRCLPSVEKLYILVVYHLRSRWCAEHFIYFLLQKLTILTFILKLFDGVVHKTAERRFFFLVICYRPFTSSSWKWGLEVIRNNIFVVLLDDELFVEQQWWAPNGHQQLICHKDDKYFHRYKYWFHFPSALGNYMILNCLLSLWLTEVGSGNTDNINSWVCQEPGEVFSWMSLSKSKGLWVRETVLCSVLWQLIFFGCFSFFFFPFQSVVKYSKLEWWPLLILTGWGMSHLLP